MKKFTKIFLILSIIFCVILILFVGVFFTPLPQIFGLSQTCFININDSREYYIEESPAVLKTISKNEMTTIVEYIRDSILLIDEPLPNTNQLASYYSQANMPLYFGYNSTLPGLIYQKAWKLSSGSVIEIPFEEYKTVLKSPSAMDLPYTTYSIHFFDVKYGTLLCVTVEEEYKNFENYNDGRSGHIDVLSFNKSLFGKWEFKKKQNVSSFDHQ